MQRVRGCPLANKRLLCFQPASMKLRRCAPCRLVFYSERSVRLHRHNKSTVKCSRQNSNRTLLGVVQIRVVLNTVPSFFFFPSNSAGEQAYRADSRDHSSSRQSFFLSRLLPVYYLTPACACLRIMRAHVCKRHMHSHKVGDQSNCNKKIRL